jgi:hypothetical protein
MFKPLLEEPGAEDEVVLSILTGDSKVVVGVIGFVVGALLLLLLVVAGRTVGGVLRGGVLTATCSSLVGGLIGCVA